MSHRIKTSVINASPLTVFYSFRAFLGDFSFDFPVGRPAAPLEPASDFVIQYFSQYFFGKMEKKGEKKKDGKNYWVKYH